MSGGDQRHRGVRRIRDIAAAAVALAAALSLGNALQPEPARGEVIERVVAVVNDDAVFLSDLRQRAAPFLDQVMNAPSEVQRMSAIQELYRQVLDRMIQEELFTQAASQMSITVRAAEVDTAIANVMRQARQQQPNLTEEQFWQAVAAQGFTRESYRDSVRRQLLRLRVLNARARNRVNITEEQVRERYQMEVARARRQAEYTAAQLFVEVPEGASATEVAEARARANEIRAQTDSIDAFWDAGGMRLGTLSQGDLPPALEEALAQLEPGEIGQPVRGPNGFHVFLLLDRQQAAARVPPYDEVRMPIYQQMMEEAMSQQEEIFLEELRRRAVVDIRL